MRKGTVRLDPEAIRRLRESRGWTQEQLAGAAKVYKPEMGRTVPIAKKTVENIEAGRPTTLPVAKAVADALGVPLAAIIRRAKPAHPERNGLAGPGPAKVEPPGPPSGAGGVPFSAEVEAALGHARTIVESWNHGFLGVPHLLVGLAMIESGVLRTFLDEHAIAIDEWSECIRGTVGYGGPDNGQGPVAAEPTEAVQEIFAAADRSRRLGGAADVDERSVVLELIRIRSDYLDGLGQKLGLSVEGLRSRVKPKCTPLSEA
jgi:transcriptional regulator with XRE-family HTH domain